MDIKIADNYMENWTIFAHEPVTTNTRASIRNAERTNNLMPRVELMKISQQPKFVT